MPWEIRIVSASGVPLGSRVEVLQTISAALPSIEWREEPPLIDLMREEKGADFEDWYASTPDFMKDYYSTPHLQGRITEKGIVIDFFGFENDPTTHFHAEVRGNGDPSDLLRRLCASNAWIVLDSASGNRVDLSGRDTNEWDRFLDYRDAAIRKIRSAEDEQ